MAPTKEELSKLKLSELQKELEFRGLDVTGKKVELVDRLWLAMESGVEKSVSAAGKVSAEESSVDSKTDTAVVSEASLLARLRLLKEKQRVDQERIRVRARADEDETRLQAQSEQLQIELQLADMGRLDESVTGPLRIESTSAPAAPAASVANLEGVLSSQVRRTLLPSTELRPFSGEVKEFRLFMKAFEARIASKTDDEGELLFYLEQFTRGKANQLVRSCLHLQEGGFVEAKRLLETRYGNKIRLIDSYVEEVRVWARISSGDVEGLDRFVLFLTEIKNAMSGVTLGEFEHPSTLRLILSKVPQYLQDRWLREADKLTEAGRSIRFADLVGFLTAEVRVRRSPLFGVRPTADTVRQSETSTGPPQRHRVSAARVSGGDQVGPGCDQRCLYCSGTHSLDSCRQLVQKPWEERRRFLFANQLCFACLRRGHRSRSCRRPLSCANCNGRHPTAMHVGSNSDPGRGSSFREQLPVQARESRYVPVGDVSGPSGGRWPRPVTDVRSEARSGVGAAVAPPRGASVGPPGGGAGGAVVSASLGVQGMGRTALPIVAVRLRGPNGEEVVTNGFLDSGSSGSFVTGALAERIGAKMEKTSVCIETLGNESRALSTSLASGVQVRRLDGGRLYPLPPLLTVDSLPVTLNDRCRSGEFGTAAHLQDVELSEVDAPVEILLGSNCAALIAAREVRSPPSGEEGLCAVRTNLGWYVMGCVPGSAGSGGRQTVNFLRVQDSCIREQQDSDGCPHKRMYEQDFRDLSDDSECLSVEDREWLSEVRSSVRRDDEGHFEIPLPKVDIGELPDSFQMASRRLDSLRKRFRADHQYFEAYRGVISSLAEDGYAVPAPDEATDHPVWYLPHHGVMEPEKGKLRVVFDCAAKSHGVCLNDLLKGGPILTNSLLGVLCRFREGPVAFTADVQSMYHRVHVPEPDTNLLRFLWFRDSDPEGEIQVWKMRSHVFGAVSSGSVASFALRYCADEGRTRYPEAADVLLRKTYVDDALCATDSVESAAKLAHDLKELCSSGAFNMTKFTSNSAEVLKQIPVKDRGKNVKELDLDRDSLGSERALGLRWSIADDSFSFQFRDREKPVTRRGILSTVSSIFDPLGVVAPVTLLGRVLLQQLCALTCGWDDPVPRLLAGEWHEWLAMADELSLVKLDRCIVGPPGDVMSTQMHVFADASETAYSAVAYLVGEVRTPDGSTERVVKFLMGKSLVNPVRFVTIPRLELAAAVLAVKVRRVLMREMDTVFDSIHMWSDSMVVLSYVRNRTTRFRTYVANRVAYIHDGSEVSDWAYVPSKLNPADVGSRGCPPAGLSPWLSGPEFLREERTEWPSEPAVQVTIPECEVKPSPVALVCVDSSTVSPCDALIGHFSSFDRLKRAVAWYRKFISVLRDGTFRRWCLGRRRGLRRRELGSERALTVTDLISAERALLRHVQRSSLSEFPCGDAEGPVLVSRASALSKLRPTMLEGLLVVGGRLSRSDCVSEETKYPVILPRRHHVTRLIIRDAHERVGHEGRDHTFWEVRQRYWVVGAGPEIRKMIRSCVTCRKVNARPQKQLMADLPQERVSAETPAFFSVQLDVFGPIMVKTGRVERKRYGLMCVCVVTRAVHIELLDSLRADSLINAIRRISARRGPIRQVRSDMGTNLTGADRELRESLKDVSQEDLQRAALKHTIDWRFNPPTASHFSGGVERQIRTFRKIWRSMPLQQRVDEESLRTLFCEIESVMNGRPLTYVSTSSDEIEPLTPSHLLFLRGGAGPIPGTYTGTDSLSRRRWRHVQYLAQQFWVRWKREYMLSLQSRHKWKREVSDVRQGDVVLLVDQDVPRGLWQMGRIVKTFPSQDGLVRKALVKTSKSAYLRPIHKMVLISPEADLD